MVIGVDQNDDWSVDVVAMFHFCSIGTEKSDYYFYSRLLFTRYRNGYYFFCSIGTERTFTADYFLQDTGMVITFYKIQWYEGTRVSTGIRLYEGTVGARDWMYRLRSGCLVLFGAHNL